MMSLKLKQLVSNGGHKVEYVVVAQAAVTVL